MALGHALVRDQEQDPGDPDKPADDSQPLMMELNGQVAPTVEVKGVVMLIDSMSDTLVKQRKSALDRCDVHREVGAVENQDFAVKHRNPGHARNCIRYSSHF